MRVEFSDEAKRDLEEIGAFIARDNPLAAERWVDRLADRALQLGDAPHVGKAVPEFRDPLVRQVLVTTYRFICRVEADRVLVLTTLAERTTSSLMA